MRRQPYWCAGYVRIAGSRIRVTKKTRVLADSHRRIAGLPDPVLLIDANLPTGWHWETMTATACGMMFGDRIRPPCGYQVDRKVVVPFTLVGHRGAMGLEPENTLRSFRRAESDGADEIELDLWLSKDGHLVVMHDRDVERTTDGQGEVAALTLAEIKTLDAGLGETVPTFDEVLEVVNLPIQAEIKSTDAARAALDTIRERGIVDMVTVTSFMADVVRAAKEYLPAVETGLIFSGIPEDSIQQATGIGASLLCVGVDKLNPEFVAAAHGEGLRVMGWPANGPEQLLRALRAGADGVTSDFPALLRDSAAAEPEVRELLAAVRPSAIEPG